MVEVVVCMEGVGTVGAKMAGVGSRGADGAQGVLGSGGPKVLSMVVASGWAAVMAAPRSYSS